MKKIPFFKMHWIWNDFIILDSKDILDLNIKIDEKFVQKICNRNFWIWSDWLLILENSKKADFKYIMYNPDWSTAEMCGNWIRCFMKYLIDRKITDKKEVLVETWAWILKLELENNLIKVDMWAPRFSKKNIWIPENKEVKWFIFSEKRKFEYLALSMWNPHCVIFIDEKVKDFDLNKYWAPIEKNTDFFENKINVEFIEKVSDIEINFRVYERWAWETLACGTWACASVVAWIVNWKLKANEEIKVNLLWWILKIKWSWKKEDSVIMTGWADFSFKWEYFIS